MSLTRDELRERLRLQSTPLSEADAHSLVRDILQFRVSQAPTLEDVGAELAAVKDLAPSSRQLVCRERDALRQFLAAEQPAGVRSRRVASEGHWQLDDPSDLGATRFLNALLKVYEQALSSEDTG